ncbi:hypothetical protein PS639_06436 [Pseudomonas fluorescens]|nr:hypothetical protein PS639_06436 [Pseudomonas fluorescens]
MGLGLNALGLIELAVAPPDDEGLGRQAELGLERPAQMQHRRHQPVACRVEHAEPARHQLPAQVGAFGLELGGIDEVDHQSSSSQGARLSLVLTMVNNWSAAAGPSR